MKKLYLLFGFALVGVLFFACQKDEPVVETIQGIETESVERSTHPLDFTNCINDGGCPCRLINLNQTGTEIDMCTEFGHYHYNPFWPGGGGIGLDLYNWERNNPPQLFSCSIPMNDCDPTYPGRFAIGWELHTTDTYDPRTDAADHYFFPHNTTISFCFIPEGYIKICNPEIFVAEWHLVCELDVHPNSNYWQTFFIPSGQCKIFYVGSDCSVQECEEIP